MPPDPLHILLLFGVGVVAGTINVMAGGGSALTLPVLLLLGLDGATANGTNRVGIIVQNIFAVASFHRERVSRLRQSLVFGACTLPGAVLGALVAVRISDAWFERILGVILLGVVATMLIPRGARPTTPDGTRTWWVYPALVGVGFYGGFIQVGVGFLIMATLYHLLRIDLVVVNVHKVAMVLLYTLPALLIFAATGHVDWRLGLALGAGTAVGGYGAAKLAVRGGERVVRGVLIVAVLLLALKILGVF